MPSFYSTILLLHVAGSFNEKGNIPFVIKIEKREEEKKLSPTLTKCFANIPTFSHVHNYYWAGYKVKKCRHAVVMCFRFGAMQHYVDNLLLLALNLRIRLATIYTLCTYLPDAFPYDDFQLPD